MADQPDALQLPLPPPFMRSCPQCAELLDNLVDAFVQALTGWPCDVALRVQISLARHLAVVHPHALPAPHSDGCTACAHYQQHDADRLLWHEHLARGLFLPAEIARLL